MISGTSHRHGLLSCSLISGKESWEAWRWIFCSPCSNIWILWSVPYIIICHQPALKQIIILTRSLFIIETSSAVSHFLKESHFSVRAAHPHNKGIQPSNAPVGPDNCTKRTPCFMDSSPASGKRGSFLAM